MAKKESSGTKRTRNFATVVYPESAPSDWQEILVQQFVPAFISPLHDQDINPTGEAKKAHYHVIIMFDSVKTCEQAKDVFDKIGGVGCEIVQSLRGYARYLCHLDNPDKQQYRQDQVRCLCGADFTHIIGLTTDKYIAIDEMMTYCDQNNIISYYDLVSYARAEHYDWFRILCDSGTIVIKEFLRSRAWTSEQEIKRQQIEADRMARKKSPAYKYYHLEDDEK